MPSWYHRWSQSAYSSSTSVPSKEFIVPILHTTKQAIQTRCHPWHPAGEQLPSSWSILLWVGMSICQSVCWSTYCSIFLATRVIDTLEHCNSIKRLIKTGQNSWTKAAIERTPTRSRLDRKRTQGEIDAGPLQAQWYKCGIPSQRNVSTRHFTLHAALILMQPREHTWQWVPHS